MLHTKTHLQSINEQIDLFPLLPICEMIFPESGHSITGLISSLSPPRRVAKYHCFNAETKNVKK